MWSLVPFAAIALAFSELAFAAVVNVLFVGSSFTHGNSAPVLNFNSANVTDINETGYGGIPGIFKRIIDDHPDIGNDFNVIIEAVNGTNLAWHAANRAYLFSQMQWNVIVLQEDSTAPLSPSRGGNIITFSDGVAVIMSLIQNARPGPWCFRFARQMQDDLYASIYSQALAHSIQLARVGESFMQAVAVGLADSNPYDTTNATIDLWSSTDHYRPSKCGSYLAALQIFFNIINIGAEDVPPGPGSASAQLSISSASPNS
ncbi:hypothetical protein BKA62DRAFT_676052 [Auriculariales sp. MPI-PUGE-AT-0066]|nr:hypothetical protein BKA62DRAFT_676052 [Auriculariales sp. MPI-PUGE-AT-0066]